MDIRELRIGNLVDTVNHGNGVTSPNKQPMWIQAIELHSVELCHLKDTIHDTRRFLRKSLNDIIPIPITEEWLLKLGFEKIEGDEWKVFIPSNNCETSIEVNLKDKNNPEINIWTAVDGDWSCIKTDNKFVHQLQNLYFALTGKEL